MKITYDAHHDLLYLRLDEQPQPVTNVRLNDDIVIDMGKDKKIVGIEIMDASQHVNLRQLLPVEFDITP